MTLFRALVLCTLLFSTAFEYSIKTGKIFAQRIGSRMW